MKNKNNILILSAILVISMTVFLYSLSFDKEIADLKYDIEYSVLKKHNQNISNQKTNEHNASDIKYEQGIDIPIAPLMTFSGMKAEKVLNLRRAAIKSSPVFSKLNYNPSNEVYRLVDGLPWISAHELSCNGLTKNIGKGPSRESFPILNPEALINNQILGYDQPVQRTGDCSEIDYLLPDKIIYNEQKMTIYAYINATAYMNKFSIDSFEFYPCDSNARDLGYNWVYSPKENNKNIAFLNSPNVSDEIFDTRGYFHQGYACRLETGCNNYSPSEPHYGAKILSNDAKIVFKLWKQKSTSKNQAADFNYEIIYY